MKIERIKKQYPVGTVVKCINMEDDHAIPPGTNGVVQYVDDIGQLHVNWENGSTLALIIGVDEFEIVEQKTDQELHEAVDVNLKLSVPIIRKDYFQPQNVVIEKAVQLSKTDYLKLLKQPLSDHAFIEKYNQEMYVDDQEIMHCILYYSDDFSEGIVVDSEGYNYARYQGYINDVHSLIETAKIEKGEFSDKHLKLKVLVVEPNGKPYVAIIDNDLDALNQMVGGHIEVVYLSDTAEIICNEEGKLLNLPANRRLGNDVLAGRFIIVGSDINSEHFTSLSQNDINKYTQQFNEIEMIDQSEVQKNMGYTIIGF